MATITNYKTSFSMVSLAVATTTLLLLLLFTHPAAAGGPPKDMCKDAPFVGVCRAAVGQITDPVQAFKASVKTLITNTKTAKKKSKELGKTSEVCNENYSDALDELQTTLEAFEKKDKGTVQTYLSAVLSDYMTCEDSWEEVEGAGRPLLLYNKILHRMASNCLYFEKQIQY